MALDPAADANLLSARLSQAVVLNPVAAAPSLWALAYRDLRLKSPDLVEKFQNVLGVDLLDVGGDTERLAHRALQVIDGVSQQELRDTRGSARRYYEQSVKVVRASREFIAPLVATNLHAAAAWTGVSLLLSVSRWPHVVVYNTK